MAVHFALRSRIRLDPDPPARRRAVELPPLTVPVAFYWAVMGALTWGVFTGALRIDDWAAAGAESWAADEWGTAEDAAGEGEPAAPLAAPEPTPPSEPPSPSEAAFHASLPLPAPDLEAAPTADVDVDAPSGTTEPASAPEAPEVNVPSPADEERPRRAEAWSPPPSPFAPAAAAPAAPTPPGALPSRDVAARRTDVGVVLPPVPSPAPEPPPREDAAPANGLPSCEAAAASASDAFDLSSRSGSRAPDVTRDAYARILENGAYLAPCGVPASTRVGVCVAVKEGRAAGITVTLEPPSARVRACVERAVRSLRFPSSPRLDVTRTTFDAAR